MRIIFSGTSEFAITPFKKLLSSNYNICAVYTKPDKPRGRGQKITPTLIKQLAISSNIPVYQPVSLKNIESQKQLQDLNGDIFINVAYGLILPDEVLNMFKFGCINIHPSLLPLWRGASPIQRAIMSGDKTTGVTIMKMDSGLDTGGIYKQESLIIEENDTTATLSTKASELGAKLLLEVLKSLETNVIEVFAQDGTKSSYAEKISKQEGRIVWSKNAKEINCMIRAFNPWPVAYTEIDGKDIRIWETKIIPNNETEKKFNVAPGTIVSANKKGIDVITNKEVLRLLKIQLPGGKALPVGDILNAYKQMFTVGKKFE